MKKIRSDSNLRWLLELAYRLAASKQVKACIKDAVEHAEGTRGNRALLDLLTFAIQQAEIAGDADTVARLNDAFGYATGLELDIALIRPDGVLHLVELKRANVPVIRRHRCETSSPRRFTKRSARS